MPLQIRRGLQAEVDSIIPLEGEPIYVTDQEKLIIGDGFTQGGINITANLQDLDISSVGNTTTLFNSITSGTIKLINGTNANSLAVSPAGTTVTGPFTVTTASVTVIKFADGSEQTTADTANPDQSLNTTSNVKFNSVDIATNLNSINANLSGNLSFDNFVINRGIYTFPRFGVRDVINFNTSTYIGGLGLATANVFLDNGVFNSINTSVTSTAPKDIFGFNGTEFSTHKLLVQIKDGTQLHSAEILIIANGTDAWKTESNIVTSDGELGTFSLQTSGVGVSLRFTANSTPSDMRIKAMVTSIES